MRRVTAICGAVAVLLISQARTSGQQSEFATQDAIRTVAVNASRPIELRQWDSFITDASRSGILRLRSSDRDPALPTHLVERFDQFYNSVRIWGADIVRDSEYGVPVSAFGMLSPELDIPTEPALSIDAARAAIRTLGGLTGVVLVDPQLVIVRLESGRHRLAYTAVISDINAADISRVFVDAHTGTVLLRYSELQTQTTVASGIGVLGSRKKMSVLKEAATYFADDQLRPPLLRTFDMRGNTSRLLTVLNGGALLSSDRAANGSTDWSDAAAVDAHVHVGWTYDYYSKRYGRRGLDNRDRPIVGLINGVSQAGAVSLPSELQDFAVNAFWCGECGPGHVGVMYFGNGIPQQFTLGGQSVSYLAGSLDIVAHELTHAVTQSTSDLGPVGESGALNEAFSDIMGTSVEFFYQPAGAGVEKADYEIGEDSFRGVTANVNGIRSLSNPQSHLQGIPSPDHYSRRYLGSGDSGGVHINAGIPGNAFYLAIEGGANRTSGLSVQGVGPANREQIEKVFYRAFTLLMPSASSFATARAATIQAARDLYGTGGTVERAITQSWDAVGVFPQATIGFSFSPSPATARTQCGTLTPPCWGFRTTAQENSGVGFSVTSTTVGFFDNAQTLVNTASITFSQVFNGCGPGSSRIAARASACADIVFGLGGRTSGYIAFRIDGTDDNGATLSFVSPLQRLAPAPSTIGPPSFAPPGFEMMLGGGR